MKQSLFTFLPFILALTLPSQVFAALAPSSPEAKSTITASEPACPVLFNGGASCQKAKNFVLDKKILNPRTGTYVDAIDPQQLTLQTARTAMFRLAVTNLSKNTLSNILVTDTIPALTTFKAASSNTVQSAGSKLAYTISSLKPGESNTQTIEVKIASASDLTQETVLLANQAQAKQGNDIASDIVTFAIKKTEEQPVLATQAMPSQQDQNTSKGGLPVYPAPQTDKAPSTGPEALALVSLLPGALIGLKFRKLHIS